jgi:hypothetical protein
MTPWASNLEGIATEILQRTGCPMPIDAFVLAKLCRVRTKPWGKPAALTEADLIRYPIKARNTRQHGSVSHELGHWALRRGGEDDRDEDAARYLAGAFMLPRERFLADLASVDWDLFALMDLHPNASAEMIVVRMTQLSEATASVWDSGHWKRSYGAHDVDGDRLLVDEVLGHEHAVRGLVSAYPMFDGSFRRVLCVRRAA